MSETPNCAIYISSSCPETCPLNPTMKEWKKVTNQITGLKRIADVSEYKRGSGGKVNAAKLIPPQVARLAIINAQISESKNNCEFEK